MERVYHWNALEKQRQQARQELRKYSLFIFCVEESKVYPQKMLTFHFKRTIILQREKGETVYTKAPEYTDFI